MPVFGGNGARLENSTVTRAPVEAWRSAERPRTVVLTYPFLPKYGKPFEVTSMLVKPSVTSITSASLPCPDSGARSGHPATLQLDEIAHHVETHAEPGSRRSLQLHVVLD